MARALDAKGMVSTAEAVRLDAIEAPSREATKVAKQDEQDRVPLEQTRSVNRPNFKP